ncbi:hypothetical protein PIB30_009155 [Stylosanthes scabra]|uniref:Uncharacterized protein n=1 Tax=Stylosanthes scabra TaxID=79078 RepID=A0ABU6X2H6_9FABA|nr:hypothetical protein [Stylosanthes scabra]
MLNPRDGNEIKQCRQVQVLRASNLRSHCIYILNINVNISNLIYENFPPCFLLYKFWNANECECYCFGVFLEIPLWDVNNTLAKRAFSSSPVPRRINFSVLRRS